MTPKTYADDSAAALQAIFYELVSEHNWIEPIYEDFETDNWQTVDWADFRKVFRRRYGEVPPKEQIENDVRAFLKQRKTNKRSARRKVKLRKDSRVGSAVSEIERVFGLPKGSVKLVNPDGRKAKSNKLVGALLRDWRR